MAEITALRAEYHGIHDEYLDLYRDERVYKKVAENVDDKFNFLIDICLTHTTNVNLKR